MRASLLSISLATVSLVACGKSMSPGNPGDDVDAPGSSDAPGANGTPAFSVRSTDIALPHGTEFTKCYYFHTSNTAPVAVDKWTSHMTPGSHHLILFLATPTTSQPADGTIDENCSIGVSNSGQVTANWTYSTAQPDAVEQMPTDDGGGKPLAQIIQPGTAGYVQMHYLNQSDNDETVHVEVNAFALATGVAYTPTAAYNTYNLDISVGPGATGVVAQANCPTPAGVKFWQMSTHQHKQGVDAKVMDGSTMLVDTTDWEHPTIQRWDNPQFHAFGSGGLTWSCTYNNTGDNANRTVTTGTSAATDEMCMANGYMFPTSTSQFCVYGQQIGGCHCL
jgi:hypothetical protein